MPLIGTAEESGQRCDSRWASRVGCPRQAAAYRGAGYLIPNLCSALGWTCQDEWEALLRARRGEAVAIPTAHLGGTFLPEFPVVEECQRVVVNRMAHHRRRYQEYRRHPRRHLRF